MEFPFKMNLLLFKYNPQEHFNPVLTKVGIVAVCESS